jgi:hypothetical protein
MADAIVQTIKIEVDGADQAAAEIKKVGQAAEEVQATAASSAGGTQELGKGVDQDLQKSAPRRKSLRKWAPPIWPAPQSGFQELG